MSYTNGLDKPTDYFNTIIYSGNGSNPRTLTGVGFQPDWVWLKNRTDANGHTLADAVRGANKTLSSDGSGAEVTDKSDGHLDAFTSDGFTVGAGTDDARVNNSGSNYVAWNWLASNTTASNTDGDITSTVSANTTAGFSIVSYTGTGSNTTVGHSLGTTPSMIIFKNRDSITDWRVYHKTLGATKGIRLSSNGAEQTSSTYFNNTEPTSSLFTVSTAVDTNENTSDFIAYCFAEKKGYSKFGSYTGNSNADGTFVYTGFKPAWVVIKRTDTTANWHMLDNKRDPINEADATLLANDAGAEFESTNDVDFLSNGFKLRANQTSTNVGTYIYMAFAESPFVTSTGIPTTAR
jgi:hypothetical protein